jgi:prepilin-type N-terminal cleavage/methylation domain-containing protein
MSANSVRAPGYTLLEVVMVMIILGIVAAFVAPVLSTAVTAYDTTSRNIEVLTKMRYAMERMAREIRAARRDPADSANYDIATMGATTLEFCRADGTRVTIDQTPATEVKLGYTTGFAASSCTAGGATTQTLTDSVITSVPPPTPFSFKYCRVDGTTCATSSGATVDKTNVAFVEITMTLAGTGTDNYTSTIRVDLRNP